jgi:hypothetical protein
MEFIDHIARKAPELADIMFLVHAVCISGGGQEFTHAWVEDTLNKMCIFCGVYMGKKNYFAAPMENFFKGYTVKESTRYTVAEAMAENLRTIHFGPWEKKYDDLCGTKGSHTILGGGQMEKVIHLGALPEPNNKQ